MSDIHERLKYIRTVLGLSQLDFSEKTKLSRSYISRCENGSLEINDRYISLVCTNLNVNEIWLRTGEGEPFFNATRAMQKTFASYFIEICAAFSPVYSAYGEILPLFENPQVMRMFNYIALRIKKGGMNARNMEALIKSFDASFPGYEDVIMALEVKSELTRKGMLSSNIAQSVIPDDSSPDKFR